MYIAPSRCKLTFKKTYDLLLCAKHYIRYRNTEMSKSIPKFQMNVGEGNDNTEGLLKKQ